jgi:hypothetical protein
VPHRAVDPGNVSGGGSGGMTGMFEIALKPALAASAADRLNAECFWNAPVCAPALAMTADMGFGQQADDLEAQRGASIGGDAVGVVGRAELDQVGAHHIHAAHAADNCTISRVKPKARSSVPGR